MAPDLQGFRRRNEQGRAGPEGGTNWAPQAEGIRSTAVGWSSRCSVHSLWPELWACCGAAAAEDERKGAEVECCMTEPGTWRRGSEHTMARVMVVHCCPLAGVHLYVAHKAVRGGTPPPKASPGCGETQCITTQELGTMGLHCFVEHVCPESQIAL